MSYFSRKSGKITQILSSAAVAIGALNKSGNANLEPLAMYNEPFQVYCIQPGGQETPKPVLLQMSSGSHCFVKEKRSSEKRIHSF